MGAEKTSPPSKATLSSPVAPQVSRDLARLGWGAWALFLVLSLATYSASDPSFGTWNSPGIQSAARNWFGRTGSFVADLLLQLLGFAAFALPVLALFRAIRLSGRAGRALATTLFLFALALWLDTHLVSGEGPIAIAHPGGAAGFLLRRSLRYLLGEVGTEIVSGLLLVASIMLAFDVPLLTAVRKVPSVLAEFWQKLPSLWTTFGSWFGRKPAKSSGTNLPATTSQQPAWSGLAAPTPRVSVEMKLQELAMARSSPPIEVTSTSSDTEEIARLLPKKSSAAKKTNEAPRAKRSENDPFDLPPLTLLTGRAEAKGKTVDRAWFIEKANILVEKLRDFGVEGEVVNISPGPVITVYEFKPASGVKIKEIANLSDDLTLALSVLSVRIVAPIPGKPVVGIEIPSPHRETVRFRDLVEETSFYDPSVRIPIVLGRLASGEPVVAGLAQMPHLLVAGSTGTGKSVFINSLIASLLYRYAPDELKLILVDPKMVELASYEGIPHLLLPVVVDSRKAALALRWAVDEMERRYGLLHEAGVRHIDLYNDRVSRDGQGEKLPYIVVVIDEYADLMAVVPKDVELSIARLAQKARASGIHLVLATQRPSTDVVTGTIKANFPSRISFRVASSVDSKTILDRTGAERLLGQGDMLLHSAGFTTVKRVQGAFLSDEELERIVSHWKTQGEPQYDERLLRYQDEAVDAESGEIDGGAGEPGQLFDRAVRLVADKGEASISLLQRHLKIGYNRAAALMEELEKAGIVAQATSASKRRAVLVQST